MSVPLPSVLHPPPSAGAPCGADACGVVRPARIASLLALAWLSGCSSFQPPPPPVVPVYKSETFDSESQYFRRFDTRAPPTCEAVRRALLSQGYVVNRATTDHVTGRKHFQPQREIHQEIEFNVTCASEVRASGPSVVFATATQDVFTLKKSAGSSASVGVGPIGSFSLPMGSSDDALVKVASETIPAGTFYERFFKLVEFYIDTDPPPPASAAAAELPAPALPVLPAAPPRLLEPASPPGTAPAPPTTVAPAQPAPPPPANPAQPRS